MQTASADIGKALPVTFLSSEAVQYEHPWSSYDGCEGEGCWLGAGSGSAARVAPHVRLAADRCATSTLSTDRSGVAHPRILKGQSRVEIKLRAERRAGELLGEMERRTSEDGRPQKALHDERLSKPKLADLGVTGIQSHRWQTVASIP